MFRVLQDEVLAISDKVVIRADDLLNWYDDTINWRYGLRATTIHDESKYDAKVKIEKTDDTTEAESVQSKPAIEMESKMLGIRSLKNSHLDFDDIEKEKGNALFIDEFSEYFVRIHLNKSAQYVPSRPTQ